MLAAALLVVRACGLLASGWIYTDLHDFDGSDGGNPISSVLVDANDNLYGTTSSGGACGYCVVWEITP